MISWLITLQLYHLQLFAVVSAGQCFCFPKHPTWNLITQHKYLINTPTHLGNVSTLQTVYKTLPFCFESKKMFTFSVHMWVQICYSKLSNGYLNLSRTWLFCIKIQQILTFIHTLYIYTCIKVCTIHEMGMWKTLGVRTHISFSQQTFWVGSHWRCISTSE